MLGISDLDDSVHEKLRLRAERHGRSLEAEIRSILTAAVDGYVPDTDLFTALADRFTQLGGVELDLPAAVRAPGRAGC